MKLLTAVLAAALLALPFADAYAQQAVNAPTIEGPAGTPLEMPSNTPLHELSDGDLALPHPTIAPEALVAQPAGATIPLWANKVKVRAALGAATDTFVMVGIDPTKAGNNRVVTVPTVVVPIVFTFKPQNVVFDPTTRQAACEPSSALALTVNSPIFKSFGLTVNGTAIGTGQYPSLFQRANFHRFTKAGAINPKFGLNLAESNPVKVNITANDFPIFSVPCGKLGALDINVWDPYVQKSLFPLLKNYIKPTQIPIFLFYNVVLYQGTTSNCCILGYHNAFLNPSFGKTFQTYGIADFDMTRGFTAVSDVSVMSHEVDELQDDPSTGNPTPAWGHIGQVSGCQNNLEVGDPLSGHIYPIKLNGFTYHVQDLAFFSWFYRHDATMATIATPHTIGNFGSNNWYSLFGTTPFKTNDAGALCH